MKGFEPGAQKIPVDICLTETFTFSVERACSKLTATDAAALVKHVRQAMESLRKYAWDDSLPISQDGLGLGFVYDFSDRYKFTFRIVSDFREEILTRNRIYLKVLKRR